MPFVTRRRFVCVAALAVAVGCGVETSQEGSSVTSEAALGAGTYNFGTLVSPGKCLDVSGGSSANGAQMQEWQCNGTGAQSIRADNVGNGNVRLVNTTNGKCIDVNAQGTADGTKIQLWDCNGSGAQIFRMDDLGNNNVRIVNVQSNKCVDVQAANPADGTPVQLWSCNGTNAQIWHVASITPIGGTPSGGATGGTPPPPVTSGWNLKWSDEFNGNSIDESKWAWEVQRPGWVNHELENYTDHRAENARVENGHLVIEGRHDNYNGYPYSSARLKTQGKASWEYGRVEASIQLPGGWGTWPAFWMLPDDMSRGWPACGEIDIMEEVGYDQDSIHATTHTQTYNWTKGNQRTAATNQSGATSGFHQYALEWYPDHLDMFVDGRKYFTSPNDNTGDDAWPFHKNFYIILNLAIGGDWGGAQGVDPNTWPKQMLVDYVRVYQ